MSADGLSVDGKRILWDRPARDEWHWPCEGYVNDSQCRSRVSWKDPRDDGLYCEMHKQAIDHRGVDGLSLRIK